MAGARRLFGDRAGWRASMRPLLDLLVVAVALGATLAQLRHGGITATSTGSRLDINSGLLAACSALPVLAWRRRPFAVFVLTATAGVMLAATGYSLDMLIGPAVALYMLAATRESHTPWTVRITATVVAMLAVYLLAAGLSQQALPGVELLHTGLIWAGAWLAGERARLRREHLADLRKRADRAERDAERERLLAVAEERTRIARDLHDTAGHAISLIAVRSGTARLRQDPARSLETLAEIEDVARQTAAEIDRTIVSLRASPTAAIESPAGLASLDTLIRRHTETGLAVALDVTGTPRPLTAAADQAAYRILQEALTNAARHGSGGARIQIGYADSLLELTVTNPVTEHNVIRPTGGHGLTGMRERTALLGGTLDCGRVDGAFRVCARLPDGQP